MDVKEHFVLGILVALNRSRSGMPLTAPVTESEVLDASIFLTDVGTLAARTAPKTQPRTPDAAKPQKAHFTAVPPPLVLQESPAQLPDITPAPLIPEAEGAPANPVEGPRKRGRPRKNEAPQPQARAVFGAKDDEPKGTPLLDLIPETAGTPAAAPSMIAPPVAPPTASPAAAVKSVSEPTPTQTPVPSAPAVKPAPNPAPAAQKTYLCDYYTCEQCKCTDAPIEVTLFQGKTEASFRCPGCGDTQVVELDAADRAAVLHSKEKNNAKKEPTGTPESPPKQVIAPNGDILLSTQKAVDPSGANVEVQKWQQPDGEVVTRFKALPTPSPTPSSASATVITTPASVTKSTASLPVQQQYLPNTPLSVEHLPESLKLMYDTLRALPTQAQIEKYEKACGKPFDESKQSRNELIMELARALMSEMPG